MARLDDLAAELVGDLGLDAALDACLDLLGGAPRTAHLRELPYLTGHSFADGAPQRDPARWKDFWVRSWGARGLLRIWADRAVPGLVRGLGDQHWRPAETCLRVASAHEVGEAGPGAAALAAHALPRVRTEAVRCLGIVGDTEHGTVVRAALDDPEDAVRRAAALALDRMAARLPPGGPGHGRP